MVKKRKDKNLTYELVQKQIEVYTTNNQKIKEFKEQKIDIVKDKWWLYFGK